MNCKRLPTTLLLAAVTLTPWFASAQSAASGHQLLRQAAMDELNHVYDAEPGRVEIEVANLDPRLQIPVCAEPLTARLNRDSPQGGRVTVRVECRDQSPWTRHVAASVRIYRAIVVTSRALNRGDLLGEADLTLEEQDISTLRGQVIMDISTASGQALRRAVSAGTALSLDLLTAPVLISRGDTVVLTAQRGSIAIRQTGTALQDGEAGKQIPVRNSSSEQVVQAVVTGTGEASVVF